MPEVPISFVMSLNLTFMWQTVHRDKFLIIKPTRCTDFSNFIFGSKLYMFWTFPPSIIRRFSLYTHQWYMSYRFAVCLQGGSGLNCRSILILLASSQQTCMTYTIAVCIVKKSWCWTEELSGTYRVSFQDKFEKLVDLVGFIISKMIGKVRILNYRIIIVGLQTFMVGQVE